MSLLLNPRRVPNGSPLEYSAERAPLGGGADSAPYLTPKRMVVERREKRQTKTFNKTNLRNTRHFALRGQRSGQGQVKGQNYKFPHYWLPSPTGAALIGAIHPERVQTLVRRVAALNPRPAGVFGRTRPAGGGGEGRFCPLSNSRTDGRRKTKNGKRKLSTKQILRTPKILLKEIRGQVRVRSKVKTTGFHIIGFRAQLASSWARHPKRVQRLVKRRAVLKTL